MTSLIFSTKSKVSAFLSSMLMFDAGGILIYYFSFFINLWFFWSQFYYYYYNEAFLLSSWRIPKCLSQPCSVFEKHLWEAFESLTLQIHSITWFYGVWVEVCHCEGLCHHVSRVATGSVQNSLAGFSCAQIIILSQRSSFHYAYQLWNKTRVFFLPVSVRLHTD